MFDFSRRSFLNKGIAGLCLTNSLVFTGSTFGGQAGIGGTGSPAVKALNGGIGGTGVYGNIEAFGSIYVNGLHIEFPETAQIRLNGIPVIKDMLDLDMPVAVVVNIDENDRLQATSIDAMIAVRGPLVAIEQKGSLFTVLGQKVAIKAGTKITTLSRNAGVGSWFSVFGERDENGVIHATKVAEAPNDGLVLISGFISGPDQISGIRFQNLQNLPLGQRVTAAAQAGQSGTLELTHLVQQPRVYFSSAEVGDVYVSARTSRTKQLVIDGVSLPFVGTETNMNGRLLVSANLGGTDELSDLRSRPWRAGLHKRPDTQSGFVKAVKARRPARGKPGIGKPTPGEVAPGRTGKSPGQGPASGNPASKNTKPVKSGPVKSGPGGSRPGKSKGGSKSGREKGAKP